ncbi:MAG: glycosyltransferase family 2 protein [Candidatus Woesearchaeota archaeon]|jgi:hypothetical protein
MENSLTIGIPIWNEERSLPNFVNSLKRSLDRLSLDFPDLIIELFFCLNGTTDDSEKIINEAISSGHFCNASILFSKQGKLNALFEIVKNIKLLNRCVCFIDADVELDEFCITNLFNELKLDENIFLTYSCVFPKQYEATSFVQKIQKTHYSLRDNLNPRKYFHGRAYMMRSSILLSKEPKKIPNSYWRLEDGPYVDDIYLSRLIVHSYGLNSIKESKNSILWFLPPKNLKDFYFGQRRLIFEIKRLNLLYPEHSYLQSLFFKKKINWNYFLSVNIKHLLNYLKYYFLEEVIRLFVKLEVYMISLRIIKCKKVWKQLKTTKQWKS